MKFIWAFTIGFTVASSAVFAQNYSSPYREADRALDANPKCDPNNLQIVLNRAKGLIVNNMNRLDDLAVDCAWFPIVYQQTEMHLDCMDRRISTTTDKAWVESLQLARSDLQRFFRSLQAVNSKCR